MHITWTNPIDNEMATALFAEAFLAGRRHEEDPTPTDPDLREAFNRAKYALNRVRIVVLYDDETGLGDKDDLPAVNRKVTRHLERHGITVPAYGSIAGSDFSHFMNGLPFIIDTRRSDAAIMETAGVTTEPSSGGRSGFRLARNETLAVLIRRPDRKTSLVSALSKLSGLPEGSFDEHRGIMAAELLNLDLVSFLGLPLHNILAQHGLPISQNPFSFVYEGQRNTNAHFIHSGGNPHALALLNAARAVGFITNGHLPFTLYGFMKDFSLPNILPQLRFSIFNLGAEKPAVTGSERTKQINSYNRGNSRLAPARLAKGLVSLIEGYLKQTSYAAADVSHSSPRILPQKTDRTLDGDLARLRQLLEQKDDGALHVFLEGLMPADRSTLYTFHILVSTLDGLRLLTGGKFEDFAPRTADASVMRRISLAIASGPSTKPN